MALKDDGTVWALGKNSVGELGNNSTENSSVPVQSLICTKEVELTADTSDNDVEHDLEITFLPNRTFERHITGVTINEIPLVKNDDYKVESGKITLIQRDGNTALKTADALEVIVSADYYPDSTVTQTIKPGIAAHMTLEQDITQPIANKQPFTQQPIIYLRDKYGNLCTNDNTTQVTASKKDSGDWTLAGTQTVVARGGIVTFTDLKAINDEKVEGAQLSFSAPELDEELSGTVTLPTQPPQDVPEIWSVEEGDRSVKLSWREATGANEYEVYVSTMPQSYTTPSAVTISTVHSYEITGLENGTTYYFVVRALNEVGESDYSNEVSAVPRTVPAPPSNTRATASNKKAVVSFDEPLDNGGSPIIKYIVTSYPDNVTAEGTKSPITVNALRNGVTYTFTVKAVSGAGAGKESEHSNSVKPKESSGGGSGSSGETTGSTTGSTAGNTTGSTTGNTTETAKGASKQDSEKSNKDSTKQNTHDGIQINVTKTKINHNSNFIVDPVEIKLTYNNGEKDIEVSQHDSYVEVLIPLPDNIEEDKNITGVRIDKDGSLTHVPTKIITQDGKKYAQIKTRLGGTYALINEEKSFKDMKGHWAEDIVNSLASRLILGNDKKETFEPSKKTTREEFAVIITKALGLMQKGVGKALFSDVPGEDANYDAVTIAYEYGIIGGYLDGSFGPDKEITREEAMAMMVRAMKVVGMDVSLDESEINSLLSGYPDSSNISPWAREYVAICTKLGIVTGRNDKTIAPKDSISMTEMAAMIERLLEAADLI